MSRVSQNASTRERSRALDDYLEVARASKPSNLVPAYNPVLVYSLSVAGKVRQAMTFRRPEEDYAHGSGWSWKSAGMTLDTFTAWAAEQGFELKIREKAKRINYEKPVSMRGVLKPVVAGDIDCDPEPVEVIELSNDEKRVEAQVLALRLDGLSYKKIEARMGQGNKRGFWAMKIIRRAGA